MKDSSDNTTRNVPGFGQTYHRKAILYKILAVSLLVLQNFTIASAGDVQVALGISDDKSTVSISGFFPGDSRITNRRNLGFLASASGTTGLGARISGVRVADKHGNSIESRKLIDGEYLADSEFHSWEYSVDAAPEKNTAAAAHVSWIAADRGILMLDDLLPQFSVKGAAAAGTLRIDLPKGWKAFSVESEIGNRAVDIADLAKTVIFVGRGLREEKIGLGNFNLYITLSGSWQFTDQEAAAMVGEIFRHHSGVFGSVPGKTARIGIFRFPAETQPGAWQAETRGSTVTIVSSDMHFRTQSLQRLHEQLRHEIFHLWLPNGVSLTGNYAWFYEGFALYRSLRLAVTANRIRFDDFLDTLSRAYAIDKRQNPRRPLLDLQQNMASAADTPTYARGMLIAFLLDIELLRSSRGKRDTGELLGGIYMTYRTPAEIRDGNRAVTEMIGEKDIVGKHVAGAEIIELSSYLGPAGMTLETANGRESIRVVAKPNGRQKEILDRLGYNSWRSSNRRLAQ